MSNKGIGYEEGKHPKCFDARKCISKQSGRCTILISTYSKDELCPFRKPEEMK